MNPEYRHAGSTWLPGALVLVTLLASGCELRQAMYNQEKYKAFAASSFFSDGLSARQPVEGTVARGQLRLDQHLYTGRVDTALATNLPFAVSQSVLERGRQGFDIFCSPCHDRTGRGNGMVVQRGFKQPPSFHLDRLRGAPVGHFFDVMTNGFGVMSSYASRIPPEDRWAIAAYIRALQYSQNAPVDQLPAEDRRQLP